MRWIDAHVQQSVEGYSGKMPIAAPDIQRRSGQFRGVHKARFDRSQHPAKVWKRADVFP
jgi:hypothetical protein